MSRSHSLHNVNLYNIALVYLGTPKDIMTSCYQTWSHRHICSSHDDCVDTHPETMSLDGKSNQLACYATETVSSCIERLWESARAVLPTHATFIQSL